METSYTLPCGVTLPNRICKPAMSEELGYRTGCPTPELINLYRLWGKQGQAGLIVTGNVMVHGKYLNEPRNNILEDERHLGSYKEFAQACKVNGSKAIMQISHPGRVGIFPFFTPVGPSAVAIDIPFAKLRKPRALTVAEIEDLIQRFGNTAELATKAGFDGIQIHGAHGYLVSQFLSPIANLRTDAYGGDTKRRMAFLLAIVHECRKRIGKNAILSVKLNSADFQKGGFSQDDSIEVIVELEKAGVDLLEISGGTYESPAMVGALKPSTQRREAYFLEFASHVRKASNIPLMLTGGVRTKAFADQVIKDKEVDIIGIARPFAQVTDAGARLLNGDSLGELPELRRTGIVIIDAFLQIAWHALMLSDLAHGQVPDVATLNPFYVLIRAALTMSFKTATQYPENDWKWISLLTLVGALLLKRVASL